MSEAVIVALITATATIAAQIIISHRNQKESQTKQETFNALVKSELRNIKEKFDSVNKKLEIHNGYAEKFPRIEARLDAIEGEVRRVREKLE